MLDITPYPVQLKFLQSEQKVVFFGGGVGGSKTTAILLDNLQGVHDPAYFSVFFRTSLTELETDLWPKTIRMYERYLKDANGKWIGKAHISEHKKIITWPSGARTRFSYLANEKDLKAWYGSEITKIYLDEAQYRTEAQFYLLLTRNRSMAKCVHGVRCTMNPDNKHFIYEWVKPFLDDEGYPIQEYSGRTRYWVRAGIELITGWDEEEVKLRTGKNPQTYTYIPATLEDNVELLKNLPEYRDSVSNQSESERKRLLLGCWASAEDTGLYFKRAWVAEVLNKDVPKDCVWVRGYDIGYSEPTPEYPKPDYTASVLMGKDRLGNIYIRGGFCEEFKDPETEIYGQFRKKIGDRDRTMLAQARYDSNRVYIGLPRENASGKEIYQSKIKLFSSEGFTVKQDPSGSNTNKLMKFESFASAAECGIVNIVTDTFNNKQTLEHFYESLEYFDPNKKSNSSRKDDIPDATATAYNILATMRYVPLVVRNQIATTQISSELLSR